MLWTDERIDEYYDDVLRVSNAPAFDILVQMRVMRDEYEAKLAEATRLLEAADQRIAVLEADHKKLAHDQIALAKILSEYGIDHSGFRQQAPRVQILVARAREHARQRIEEIKKRKAADKRIAELEAQLAATLTPTEAATHDGALYAEGCQPEL